MIHNINAVSDDISATEEKHSSSIADLGLSLESLEVKVEKKLENKVELLLNKLETAVKRMETSKGNQDTDMKTFKDDLIALMERVDDINEKMYDFEANKRNNLIFYGIPNEARETHSMLQQKVPTPIFTHKLSKFDSDKSDNQNVTRATEGNPCIKGIFRNKTTKVN